MFIWGGEMKKYTIELSDELSVIYEDIAKMNEKSIEESLSIILERVIHTMLTGRVNIGTSKIRRAYNQSGPCPVRARSGFCVCIRRLNLHGGLPASKRLAVTANRAWLKRRSKRYKTCSDVER